ncbi:MAG: hypothetical protein KGD63_03985 [Candidatus Lokiarchaeota archaeon]|nr:hypothetical protein [Candidatus Lokiarchaeota archaeon]
MCTRRKPRPSGRGSSLVELASIKIEYIPDSISLLSLLNSLNLENLSKLHMIGLYNLELEEKLIKLVNYKNREIEIDDTELIMNIDNFIALVSYENFEYFFKMISGENLGIFLIDNCNYFIGITEKFGMLCLPNLDNSMDYKQCLVFLEPEALKWLNK